MRETLKSLDAASIDFSQPIPILPLPNCVLLPRAIAPLHIFEPRYREMMKDALHAGAPFITMALLKPGYEAKYYTHRAAIHATACVGRVLRHERLSDGRYNLLLQGVSRASVLREDHEKNYRRGWLQPIANTNGLGSIEIEHILQRLASTLDAETLAAVSTTGVVLDVLRCPDLPLGDKLDLLTFDLFAEAQARQRFLEEANPVTRACWLTEILRKVQAHIKSCQHGAKRAVVPSDN